jgi:hypothetical protein
VSVGPAALGPLILLRENSMSEMEQARKAGGSGKPFTTAVVLAIIIA